MGTPEASSALVQARMKRQRTQHTRPELALRRELHALGLRYRLHRRLLPGTQRSHDIVFGPSRVVVDVRGCFWHACPEHGTIPKSHREWWEDKLAATVTRDTDTAARLQEQGWLHVVVWEHEEPDVAARRVRDVVADRRHRVLVAG